MKNLVLSFMFLAAIAVNAQTKFEQGMQKAFTTWGEGKSTEAAAMFERIGAAEPNEWLPDYYVSLINTTSAFQTQDKEEIKGLLAKAQQFHDSASRKAPNNAEIIILQALIHTANIVSDPMTNGQLLSGKVKELYFKALAVEPENPRAVFGLAEFEMGSARFFKADTTPMCSQIDRAVELFATFKPKSAMHPKWGADRALAAQADCKKK
jgi:hypothetical protein